MKTKFYLCNSSVFLIILSCVKQHVKQHGDLLGPVDDDDAVQLLPLGSIHKAKNLKGQVFMIPPGAVDEG